MKTIAFFGHRKIYNDKEIRERLKEILSEKLSDGYSRVLVGRHGDFDSLALSTCLEFKLKEKDNLNIGIVLTSLSILKKDVFNSKNLDVYKNRGCETIIYEIEKEHYKNRIIFSNKKMVDESDLIICYVDMKEMNSGARKSILYAIKKGKEIINLFENIDD